MSFLIGKSIRLKHFAGKYSSKCEIIESSGGIVTIKPDKAFTVFSLFEEDPVVVIYENDHKYFVCQCSIASIDYVSSTFNVLMETNEEFSNRRKDERYPTSLYGIMINSTSKETIFINNISSSGISIKTKVVADINDKIEIEATLDGSYVYISGEIKWKKSYNKYFEYGLYSTNSIPELDKMLELVKNDHTLTLRNIKYEIALSNI